MPATLQKPKPKAAQTTRTTKKTTAESVSTTIVATPARKTGPWKLPIWPELRQIMDINAAIRATTNL